MEVEVEKVVGEIVTGTKWEEFYLKNYLLFINEINDWEPDYIIPVARKSCKLLNSVHSELEEEINSKVFYLEYFDFNKIDLSNKKIAIVDDVSRRGITLKEYREDFIERGCPNDNIRTYAFIGHSDLLDPRNRFDKEAIIFKNSYFSNRKYQHYLNVESNHLLLTHNQSDLDHLVISTEINEFDPEDYRDLVEILNSLGYYYKLNDVKGIKRFGVHFEKSPNITLIEELIGLKLDNDFVFKVKFVYDEAQRKLIFIPIYFPKIYDGDNTLIGWLMSGKTIFPFNLPLTYGESVNYDFLFKKTYFYKNICLFFNALAARYFYDQIKHLNSKLYLKLRKIQIRPIDLARYLGEKIATKVSNDIVSFILDEKSSEYDKIFVDMDFNESLFPTNYSDIPQTHQILKYLRDGDQKEIENYLSNENKAEIRKHHFDATVDELLMIGKKSHPLHFTEFIDELCDFGILVPRTKFIEKENCWRRVYRCGENHPDETSWERTKAILAICLDKLGDKQTRIYLEKVLANFTHDFPPFHDRSIKEYTDNHCIYTTPYLFGPVNQTLHFELFTFPKVPFQFFNPNHIENKPNRHGGTNFSEDDHLRYKSIGEMISYERETPSEVSAFVDKDYHALLFSLKPEFYNFDKADDYVDSNIVYNYFGFFKEIYEETNTVKNILSLAIGRNIETFKQYISYNINSALYFISMFNRELGTPEASLTNFEKHYNNLGKHISSIEQKLDAIKGLGDAWIIAQKIKSKSSLGNQDKINYKKEFERILGKNTIEQNMDVVASVIKFSESFDGLTEVLNLYNLIINIRFAGISKARNIALLSSSVINEFHKKEHSDYFIFNANNEVLSLQEDAILTKQLTQSLNYLRIKLEDFIVSYEKINASLYTSVYDLQKYFLNAEVFKRKKEIQKAYEEVGRYIANNFGEDQFHFTKVVFGTSSDKTIFWTYENPFRDRIYLSMTKSNLTIFKAYKVEADS